MNSIILSLITMISLSSYASDKAPKRGKAGRCEISLTGESGRLKDIPGEDVSHDYVLIPSGRGRDDDVLPRYEKFVFEMSKEGGVLDQLGIPRTRQVVEFMDGKDMLALTSTFSPQPVPHFHDGAQIMRGLRNPSGFIYEVVWPGPDYNHGYYRDDSIFEEQLSILMHVVGHNHFAKSSFFPHYRASQPIEAGIALGQALERGYDAAPREEVEAYYMHLLTLGSMMDNSGYYQSVEDFILKPEEEPTSHQGDEVEAEKRDLIYRRGLKAPTENVLQAFVARLSQSTAAQWKKDLAEHLPYVRTFGPALTNTQIMNEGWASILQKIIMTHMGPEWNTQNHWLTAQNVMRSMPQLLISDPYWLGVRIWERLKTKFEERPEIAELGTQLEKDAKFIEYADGIIKTMDDYQFVDLGMDDQMIQTMRIAITRKAEWHELPDDFPQPPPDMPEPEPVFVVSRDPDRVRTHIKNSVITAKSIFRPRVQLRSFNRDQTGEVELVLDDEIGNSVPLDKKTVGGALYSLANVIGQPVSLEAVFEYETLETPHHAPDPFAIGPMLPPWWRPRPTPVPKWMRARVVVTPAGKLKVYKIRDLQQPPKKRNPWEERWGGWALDEVVEIDADKPEVELGESDPLFNEIEKPLANHIMELFLESDARLEEYANQNPRLEKMALHSLGQMFNGVPITGLIEHVPRATKAIEEFHSKVQIRILRAMELAMNGNGGLKKTKSGFFLKALPSQMHIQFDGKVVERLYNEATPGDIDISMGMLAPQASNPFDGDGTGDLMGPIDISPGDGGWRPGGGKGKGGPGDEPNPNHGGEDPNDPSWIPIPPDLYAELLGERVKLPNLKPKAGKTRSNKKKLKGRQNRRHGQIILDQTVANAIRKGAGSFVVDGKEPADDPLLLVEEGFGLMRPRDWVVRKAKPIPKPDTNAVVLFARDASGSTWGYTDFYKRFINDFKVLIESNYKNVVFKWIVFDSRAHEVPTESEFYRTELGGGTSYIYGVDKLREVMKRYPEQKWDRFPFIVGDLGEYWGPEVKEAYELMIEEASYSGTVKAGWGLEPFTQAMRDMAAQFEYYGFVDMGDNPTNYSIEHIRELLKNEEEE